MAVNVLVRVMVVNSSNVLKDFASNLLPYHLIFIDLHFQRCILLFYLHFQRCILHVVRDDIEYASGDIIPLWTFGLMY